MAILPIFCEPVNTFDKKLTWFKPRSHLGHYLTKKPGFLRAYAVRHVLAQQPLGLRLHFTNHIQEQTLAIEIKIGQIIRELGEVIAHTHFQVIAEMTINGCQNTIAVILRIGQLQHASFQ